MKKEVICECHQALHLLNSYSSTTHDSGHDTTIAGDETTLALG